MAFANARGWSTGRCRSRCSRSPTEAAARPAASGTGRRPRAHRRQRQGARRARRRDQAPGGRDGSRNGGRDGAAGAHAAGFGCARGRRVDARLGIRPVGLSGAPGPHPLFVHMLLPDQEVVVGRRSCSSIPAPTMVGEESRRSSVRAASSSSMLDELDFEKPLTRSRTAWPAPGAEGPPRSRDEVSAPRGPPRQGSSRRSTAGLTAWQRAQVARHPKRPYTLDLHRLALRGLGGAARRSGRMATTRPSSAASRASTARPWSSSATRRGATPARTSRATSACRSPRATARRSG